MPIPNPLRKRAILKRASEKRFRTTINPRNEATRAKKSGERTDATFKKYIEIGKDPNLTEAQKEKEKQKLIQEHLNSGFNASEVMKEYSENQKEAKEYAKKVLARFERMRKYKASKK